MPMNSVNTNVGAMIALQNLNQTNTELGVTQTRINTGKKVATAKDNGAIWAIAQNQRATSRSLDVVKESLQRTISTVDVAISAGETISDLLLQMKEKALAASDTSLDTNARNAMASDFNALRDQVEKAVTNATFNGINLLNGTQTNGVAALANADATSRLTVASWGLSLGGSVITIAAADVISVSASAAASVVTLVNASIANLSAALSRLGTGSKSLGTHLDFVGKLVDSIDSGIGNLVDADLAKESARLQALQTKQQLGIQALSIANQSSSTLLGLFR
jgi:flagellin